MAARSSRGAQTGSAAPARARERSGLGPAFLASVALHAGLAVLLVAAPVSPHAPHGRAWIEARPPPLPVAPPEPRPEPEALPAPAPGPEPLSRPAHRRAAADQELPGPPGAEAAPEASASPLSGLDSSGPGVPFAVPPGAGGPKGMAFPAAGEQPGPATVGPARRPPPIRLDDGTHGPEEIRRIAREAKAGFDALPHSIVNQKYGGPVARQSTFFPGYGNVPSDKVCRTRDGRWFRTTIPAFDLTVCERWEVDLGRVDDHTRAPPVVCVASHVQHVEERTLEAPRFYLSHECTELDQDPWHLVVDWETKTAARRCLRWEDVERENELTYRAKRFTDSYEEDSGIAMKLEVPPCDEPAEDGGAPAQPAQGGATARSGG